MLLISIKYLTRLDFLVTIAPMVSNIKLSFSAYKSRVYTILSRVACAFVPSKRMRRSIRYYGLSPHIYSLFIKKIRYYDLKDSCLKKIKYDCIFSMGYSCFVPTVLKEAGLRLFSGPFDWMYGVPFDQRFNIFINRFDKYFEKEDLVYTGLNPENNCATFKNTRTGLIYNHDFVQDLDFETEYQAIRTKYDRRINRILDKIENGKRALLVYAETNNPTISMPPPARLQEMLKLANKKYNDKIDLIYIQHDPKLKRGTAKITIVNEHLYIAKYFGKDVSPNAKLEEEELVQQTMLDLLAFANVT